MLLISSTGIIWCFDTANSWTWVLNIMRYIEPQVRYIAAKYWTLLKNIEPKVQYIMAAIYWTPLWFSFAIGERGFKISWPWYINPLPLSNSNWRRGSKYYALIYRTPPLIIIAIVEGVQNIMAVIIEPPSISNWKGGSKYHGHDTMTHCYGTQEVKKRL